MNNKSPDLELAITAAKNAGEIVKKGFESVNQIDAKLDKGFVTEIDKESELTILNILELGSSHYIMSEETRSGVSNHDTYWTVDPLDGTTNFIQRIPLIGISIALIKNKIPVIGVIYNPLTRELFYGEETKGAYLNDQKINVSDKSAIVFANHGYSLENQQKYLQVVTTLVGKYSIRKFGSTAYELATVARGAVDGFAAWGDELWDHAAGILLVREAGGIVTDWKNNEWTTDTNYVFAGNSQLHKALLPEIAKLA